MVTRTHTYDYEQSSEGGREREVPIPWTRLTDATPTLGDPAQVTGLPAGTQVTGTVVEPGVAITDPYAILNVSKGAVYRHNVRTVDVLHIAGNLHEHSWRDINIGDTVYYSAEVDTLTAGVAKLGLCPLQSDGATLNAVFGHVVLDQEETVSSFPKLAGASGNTHMCAIEQD